MATSSLFQRTLKHAFRQPTRPTPFFTPHAHRSARLHTLDTPRAALSSAALSPAAVKPSSVLHFLRTRILQATHRSSRPRGSQSSWEPPRPSSSWLQRTPGSTIVWGIAGLNGLVFIGWYIAKANYEQGKNPRPLVFMLENFTASWNNVANGRVWTLLTSCFSHNSFDHILFNGLSYYFMAPAVNALVGNKSFLAIYLVGGLGSSMVSLLWNDRRTASQGASGAIYSIVSFFACAYPRVTFLIFGIVPCPAWLWVGGIFAYDAYRSITNQRGTTDTAGHIGGLLTGAACYMLRGRLGMRF